MRQAAKAISVVCKRVKKMEEEEAVVKGEWIKPLKSLRNIIIDKTRDVILFASFNWFGYSVDVWHKTVWICIVTACFVLANDIKKNTSSFMTDKSWHWLWCQCLS